jgi:hypothetical protein
MNRLFPLAVVLLLLACSSSELDIDTPPPLADGQALLVTLVLPSNAGPGLAFAGEDLLQLMAQMTLVPEGDKPEYTDVLDIPDGSAIRVVLLPTETKLFGETGYRITSGRLSGSHIGLLVEAATQIGAAYGLYQIAGDLGLRFIHPEETFVPADPLARLPWSYTGKLDVPDFRLRGFHEHTQHPIPMSDFLLRPGNDSFREYVSNTLKWLFRNRQNVLTFHLLKTVNLTEWIPYITDIREEATRYGIKLGPFLSFSDQQQNCFKLLDDEALDDAGQPLAEAAQIVAGIDLLMEAGFDLIGLQIGSSEFTKPGDDIVVERLNTLVDHLALNYPSVEPFAWIHVTCSLKTDNGGFFYHLPLKADLGLGAFVHTTMFYSADAPAPVYDCEDFTHQQEFMTHADGLRTQVFFPETAWWLGFDNNVPLALPITGYSRQYDVQEVLPGHDIDGHVTFTTGREWGYWQYDHYLTQLTWNRDLTWDEYLDWIAPVFGGGGPDLVALLKDWTVRQREFFYETNPLITFYLSGELKQDEVGAQAGILARRPKLPYKTVLEMDDEAFAQWQTTDFGLLETMLDQFNLGVVNLPQLSPELATDAYHEAVDSLWVTTRRVEHTLALYGAVAEARAWRQEQLRAASANPPEEPDATVKATAKATSLARLADARVISAGVVQKLQAAESRYRYPVEILARAKPESLTAYPFGYLEQTSSGHFWVRRDDQLETFLTAVFDDSVQAWENEPDAVVYTDASLLTVTEPDDAMAAAVLAGFIPRLLVGTIGFGTGTAALLIGVDGDENGLPEGDITAIAGSLDEDGRFVGTVDQLPLPVTDSTGAPLGTLHLLASQWDIVTDADLLPTGGTVAAQIASEELIALIMSVGGIDVEGAGNLVKAVYGIPPEESLPEQLPLAFAMTLSGLPLI